MCLADHLTASNVSKKVGPAMEFLSEELRSVLLTSVGFYPQRPMPLLGFV
jgi:hypothetical protein